MKEANRYFQIVMGFVDFVIIEYPPEFGIFTNKHANERFIHKEGIAHWIFMSDFPIHPNDQKEAVNRVKTMGERTWKKVDLAGASNPLSKRQPAMKKKGRK